MTEQRCITRNIIKKQLAIWQCRSYSGHWWCASLSAMWHRHYSWQIIVSNILHEATYNAQELLLYLQQCISLFHLMEYNFSQLISQTKDEDAYKYYILIIWVYQLVIHKCISSQCKVDFILFIRPLVMYQFISSVTLPPLLAQSERSQSIIF